MLPVALLFLQEKERRKDVAQAMLPAFLPGSQAVKAAFAVVDAEQRIKRQEKEKTALAEGVAAAVETAHTRGRDLTPQELPQVSSEVAKVVARAPQALARINTAASSIRQSSAAENDSFNAAFVSAVVAASEKEGGLTKDELPPEVGSLGNAADLLGRINAAGQELRTKQVALLNTSLTQLNTLKTGRGVTNAETLNTELNKLSPSPLLLRPEVQQKILTLVDSSTAALTTGPPAGGRR